MSGEGGHMRSKVLFLLAILMGIITTAIFFYMTQMDDETEVKEEAIPMVEVVVTNKQIGANQLLSAEDVVMKEIPESQLHPAMIQSTEQVPGKFSTDFMEEGEVVLSHRLKSSLEEDTLVSRKVTEEMLGVSVGVDIVRSVSNLIEPEDYVDVIYTEERLDD